MCYMKRSNMRTSPPGCQMLRGISRMMSTERNLWTKSEVEDAANNRMMMAGEGSSELCCNHRRVDSRPHTSYETYGIFGQQRRQHNTKTFNIFRNFSSTTGAESLNDSQTDSSENDKGQDVEGNGGGEQLNRRKTYYRAKQLCSILKKKQEAIYKEFTLKHRKRFYTLQNGIFYEFPSSKEIIIDEDAIMKSKNQRNKMLLRKSRKEIKREIFINRNLERTPVIVILGHFNHGKTTLLDALGRFTIVNKEAHGITQVRT